MSPRLRAASAILAAFVVSLGVYAASLRGDVSLWDTGDLQTVPYILGIPYPTGFPGYVLIGWLWSHVLPFGNVAWRMNLLCALASAGTVAALAALLEALGSGSAVALAASLAYAFAGVPWSHATYVDVHPISFCTVAWAFVAAVRWVRDGRPRDAAAAALLAAAGLAIDDTTVLTIPGLAAVAFARRPPLGPALRVSAIAAAIVLGTYAYLPLRSAAVTAARVDPTLALGIPPGRPFWDDGDPETPRGFVRLVAGTSFGAPGALGGALAPATLRRIGADVLPLVARELGGLLPWVALFGGGLLWWRQPLTLGGLLAAGALPLFFAFAYPAESDVSRYELPALFVLTALAGYGAGVLLPALLPQPRLAAAGVAALALVLVLAHDAAGGVVRFDRSADRAARDVIDRVRARTPANAIVVAPWMYATALGYAADVERSLGDRIVVTADPDTFRSHYRAWLRRRPIVVVSDDDPSVHGFRLRRLGHRGDPELYALR